MSKKSNKYKQLSQIACFVNHPCERLHNRNMFKIYSRFFYLKDPESINFELATYNFEVNIFGSRASSFILAAVLKHHLDKYSREEPLIPQIQDNLLVDNLVTGCSTETEAIEFFQKSRSIFSDAAMNLRDWSSNNETINTLSLAKNVYGAEVTHLLGIKWNTKLDQISLDSFVPTERTAWTKRQIFSEFARIFDPFGWLAPVVLTGKVFIRSLWQSKVLWDGFIHRELQKEWETILISLKEATEFKYPRQISSNDTYRLDIFVDSSLICYAAVAYLNNQLLFTKTRLAPDRTIPDLELMAMTLGVKLGEFLQKNFEIRYPKN